MPQVYNKHHRNAPPGAVYIGRGSPYGNPFVIGRDGDRAEVIRRFECEVLPSLDVTALRGQDVVCFCAPLPCHGDAIVSKANSEERMMVADVFGLHVREPTDRQIDAGAEALRQLEQGGRLLRKWADLPNSDKRKWRDKAATVLRAAGSS